MVMNQGTKQRVQRILGDCWQWKTNGQCVKGIRLRILSCSRVSEKSRTRSPRGESPNGTRSRWLCKDYLRGTCNNSFCKRWHPPECLFYKTKSGCRFGEKCSFAHRQVGMKEDLLPTNVTIDQGNLKRGVMRSWDEDHLIVDHLMRHNWVAYFKT